MNPNLLKMAAFDLGGTNSNHSESHLTKLQAIAESLCACSSRADQEWIARLAAAEAYATIARVVMTEERKLRAQAR